MFAEKYHHTLVQRLERIQVQWTAIEAAGKLLADRACAAGKVFVYDRMGAVMTELSFRAGGLMVIRPLDFEDVVVSRLANSSNYHTGNSSWCCGARRPTRSSPACPMATWGMFRRRRPYNAAASKRLRAIGPSPMRAHLTRLSMARSILRNSSSIEFR